MPAMYTKCHLSVEFRFECDEGTGSFQGERNINWPGVPAVGQHFMQSEVPWTIGKEIVIDEIVLDGDREPDRLFLSGGTVELSQAIESHNDQVRRPNSLIQGGVVPLTKETFLGCVQELVDAGWKPSWPANWWPKRPPNMESISVPDPADDYNDDGLVEDEDEDEL